MAKKAGWKKTTSSSGRTELDILSAGIKIKVSGKKTEQFTGLNKRPGALVAKKVTGMMNWLREAVHDAMDTFWMRKAEGMLEAVQDASGAASSGASPNGYPYWAPLSAETIKRKMRDKRGAADHAEDIWQKYEGFVGWLEDVSGGGEQGISQGGNWHTMNFPSSLPYVQYVNDGTGKMPARPIFVFTDDDIRELEQMLDEIIDEAIKG